VNQGGISTGQAVSNSLSPLVTVIVPIYNQALYLDRCIRSILDQRYLQLEILLIDDGSIDGSSEIADDFASSDSRIRVFHKPNGGLSSARNMGLDAAGGSFIAFVDSDDFLHADFISVLLRICTETGCDIAQCGFEKGTGSDFSSRFRSGSRYGVHKGSISMGSISILSPQEAFRGLRLKTIVCNKLFRAPLLADLRFPLGKIHEDEFFTYKAVYRSTRIGIVADKLYYYRQTAGSITRGSANTVRYDIMEAYEERLQFFRERKEDALALLSAEKYVISLIYKYAVVCREKAGVKHERRLTGRLKELRPVILKGGEASFAVRLLIRLFSLFPRMSALLVYRMQAGFSFKLRFPGRQ
jgi:glycosyltransferase involved in cell wall biosynthesis